MNRDKRPNDYVAKVIIASILLAVIFFSFKYGPKIVFDTLYAQQVREIVKEELAKSK